MPSRWVLITGCSSGIGRALVDICHNFGWGVIATARNLDTLSNLDDSDSLKKIQLDVTDNNSIRNAVTAVESLPLHALINNAGYGQMGPLEALSPEELRMQFETNVIGLQVVTNEFLPLIRRCREGEGRIVYVASVLGRLSIPLTGAYNASKHAVVALAETLSMEIGSKIPVILIEPGSIQSKFRTTLTKAWGNLPHRVEGTEYHSAIARYANKREDYAGKHGMSAEECAQKIFNAMNADFPPRRVIIGADSFWAQVAHRIVPKTLWEYVLRKKNGIS
ncbi:MAG: SDR family oxidoreductase [Holophagaceae bacterium]|nr:SDR family oxidoreductase [Holophagaceae bacterium]